MSSGDDVARNLGSAARLLEEAAAQGVRLAILPENFSFMGPDLCAKHRMAEETVPAVVLPFLSEAAARHRMHLVGGSVLLPGSGGKLRNASPVFGPDGTCLAIYDKIHLFDIDLPGESHRESDLIEAGTRPLVVEMDEWRIGLSICYDLRFPELYRHYAREGCRILTVPSAFTVPTGRAHWEVLLRARAIENQSYVLAPAQFGAHPGGRHTWGHSMIVDPWGEIVAQLQSDAEGVVAAEIDPERLEEVQRRLPALRHRRIP